MSSSVKLSTHNFADLAARIADSGPEKSYQMPTPSKIAAPAAQPTRPPVTTAGAVRVNDFDFLLEAGAVTVRSRFGFRLAGGGVVICFSSEDGRGSVFCLDRAGGNAGLSVEEVALGTGGALGLSGDFRD